MSPVSVCVPVCIPACNFFPDDRRRFSPRGDKVALRKACTPVDDDYWSPRGLPGASASIPYLREAIDSLDSKMADLVRHRRELESRLEKAVRVQSPVLRLPSELLSLIFVMGVLGMGDEDPVMISTLMLVCRYWAEVVLQTPALWSRICINPHNSLTKARRRLERSKTFPLDITVSFDSRLEYTANIAEQIILAMDLIRPALRRTRSFYLSVPNRPLAHTALSQCREDAPLLETLSIRIFHSMQDDTYYSPPLPLFNGHTPRLRSCSFVSFNFGWDLQVLSRLRILKLDGYFNISTPSANTLLGILRECPELEDLTLRNLSSVDSQSCTSADDCDLPQSKIHLRHLTRICFYYAGIALARHIMDHITVPNLASLEMCYLENVTPILNSLYTQALTRLPLRHLRIETCLFNEMKFLNLLRRLGSLVTLELVDVEDVSSNLLRGLSSSQPWICPRLEALVLDGCTIPNWDSLRTFVESRLPPKPARYHTDYKSISSSASAAAYAWSRAQAQNHHRSAHYATAAAAIGPQRLHSIDVTRCTQISREMVQWLRMYVASVKCESAKDIWGEHQMQ